MEVPDGRCAAAQALFLDSQLVSLAVNNVAQFTLTLANQKKAPCSLHASLLTMVSKHLV